MWPSCDLSHRSFDHVQLTTSKPALMDSTLLAERVALHLTWLYRISRSSRSAHLALYPLQLTVDIIGRDMMNTLSYPVYKGRERELERRCVTHYFYGGCASARILIDVAALSWAARIDWEIERARGREGEMGRAVNAQLACSTKRVRRVVQLYLT